MIPPLFGLILAGGKSTRMRSDKALLAYHGENQVQRSARLLAEVCDQVFISLRPGRFTNEFSVELPVVSDSFGEIGPLGGILSAQAEHPSAAWLVLACDLPFLTADVLRELKQHRGANAFIAFSSTHDSLPEPLCAIYEPHSHAILQRYAGEGRCCPRKILIQEGAQLLPLPVPNALDNINTREEYREAMEKLGGPKAR